MQPDSESTINRQIPHQSLEALVTTTKTRPGLLKRARTLASASLAGLGLAALATLPLGARNAQADQLAPIGAAYVEGLHGSSWHDTQLFRDVSGDGVQGTLYLVERTTATHAAPGFDPSTSPSWPINVPAGSTLILEDAYHTMVDGEGAGALWFVPQVGSAEPLWRSRMFNQQGDAKNGMTMTPITNDDYHPAGTGLSDVLSPDGDRDAPFLVSGPEGVTGKWIYSNAAGGNRVEVPDTLGALRTKQYTRGVEQLLGFEPEPGAQLDFLVEEGSAAVFLSRTNNASNDSAFNAFDAREVEQPNYADEAMAYVNHWLPRNDSGFYLSNTEIRAMINGGMGTRSYARDMAEILIESTANTNGTTADQMETWLRDQVDGDVTNGELYAAFDPMLWDNDAQGDPTFVLYGEPSGGLVPVQKHVIN